MNVIQRIQQIAIEVARLRLAEVAGGQTKRQQVPARAVLQHQVRRGLVGHDHVVQLHDARVAQVLNNIFMQKNF